MFTVSQNMLFAQAQSPVAQSPAPAAGGAQSPTAGAQSPVAGAQTAAPAAGGAPAAGAATTQVPAGAPPAAAPQQEGNALFTFLPLILIFVAMWFLMIRPQQKREKELRKKQSEMKRGDQVITSAGIYGEIEKLEDDRVTLKVAENTRIVFQRGAIVGFTSSDAAGKDEKK